MQWDCFHQLLFVPGNNKRELLGAVFIVGSEEPTFSFPLSLSICHQVTEQIENSLSAGLSHTSVLKCFSKPGPRSGFNLLLTPCGWYSLLLNYSSNDPKKAILTVRK